jgi:hypothetical protein
MAYPNITNVLTAQKPAGIKKVYIRNASEKWQYLGQIRNGELKFTPYSTNNTYQRNLYSSAFAFEAKFELIQTIAAEVETLVTIANGVAGVANDFLFELVDAAAIPTAGAAATTGWVVVSAEQVGCKTRFVSDGNPSTVQFMEVMVKGSIVNSAMNAAVKASIDDDEFHTSGDSAETFSAAASFASYSATAGTNYGILANIRPNGFASVALDNVLSSGAETLTNFKDGRVILDVVAEEDSLGRYNPHAIDVDIEYTSMLSDDTTLLLLDDINAINTSVVVTLIDGKTITLASGLGVTASFENTGDFDKMRTIRFSHKGRLPLSTDLTAIIG